MSEVSANKNGLNATEWAVVAGTFPGFSGIADVKEFSSQLEVITVGEGEKLPAEGMYIVLEGAVRLLLNGHEIATAGKSDYFFEEHLIIDDIATELTATTTMDSRLVFLSKTSWAGLSPSVQDDCKQILFGDLVNIHLHEFQQPINCCNITAAALSITALGFSCDVNDIFQSCSLPVSYVVDDGMTLGELYDVASSYVFAKGLREQIGVELYYFDRAVMSRQDLFDAVAESDRVGGDSDILVANFGVGIAHGKPEMGGGHFALIAKCNQSTGLLHMMDVHPAKYGKIWVTSIDRLFEAMSDYDGSSRRSRGLIRFIVKEDIDVRLDSLGKTDCYPINCTRYFDLTPEKRRHIFSRSSTNLNSIHVLSMAMGILGSDPVDVDEILEAANISYTESLSVQRTAAQLADVASDYLAARDHADIRSSCRSYDGSDATTKEAWFKTQLLSIADNPRAYFMINIDYNEIVGYEAIHDIPSQYLETPVFKEFWCVCVDYEYENDVVILADMSPATSQIWRAPREKVFRGLQEKQLPAIVYLEKVEGVRDESDFEHVLLTHPLVLFKSDNIPVSQQLENMLANIGATSLHVINIDGFDPHTKMVRRKLIAATGHHGAPYLFLEGRFLGEGDEIITLARRGELQTMLSGAGLPVLPRAETPSLDANAFSYPKGGLTAPYDGKSSILLCACGSPAAAKLPQLVERFVKEGHKVRLLLSAASERFLREAGLDEILESIRPSDVYRDQDEWQFQYQDESMQVRAAHLSLCDWADCIVVAPMTVNTMAKMAGGVADNLLSSVLAAWDYRKPALLCPAFDAVFWDNPATQGNLRALRKRGAQIEGPRTELLANGLEATGAMASPDEIAAALRTTIERMLPAQTVLRWARTAAATHDLKKWERVLRAIDDGWVSVDSVDETHGDSLLHYAAGGAGELDATGLHPGVAHIDATRRLVELGIDVNHRNHYGFTALETAALNNATAVIEILLGAGAEAGELLSLLDHRQVSETTRMAVRGYLESHD